MISKYIHRNNLLQMKSSRWFSLILILTAPFLSVLDVFIINVAIPAIKKGLHATEAQVQLVIAVYLLGYASFLVTGSRFGDYFGRKKVFLLGMLGFTISSAWCGLSQSSLELNIARFSQGVSASMMVPQTIAFIQLLFPDSRERTKAFGWYGIALGLASMLGQFLGGVLTTFHFFIEGWRLIFFINIPVGVGAMLLTVWKLEETEKDVSQRFDLRGIFLLTLSLISFIIPLIQGRELGWPSWCIILLLSSVLFFCSFFYAQRLTKRQGGKPLIDISLFSIKDLNYGLLAVVCCYIVHSSFLMMSAILLQNGFGFSPLRSGSSFVLWGSSMLLFSLWSIKLVKRNGKRTVLIGVALMFTSVALQIFFFTGDVIYLPVLLGILIIHGAGAGLTYPTLMNVTLKNVPHEFAGAAAGLYSTAQQIAGAFGVATVGGLFFTVIEHSTRSAKYQQAFLYGSLANLFILAIMGYLVAALPGGYVTEVAFAE
jgi:EmrB/QacA subfamily drug resistance transporter